MNGGEVGWSGRDRNERARRCHHSPIGSNPIWSDAFGDHASDPGDHAVEWRQRARMDDREGNGSATAPRKATREAFFG